jgi:hypothetical protein
MAASLETELALIRFRLDQIVEAQERAAETYDRIEGRVDAHSRRFVAADAARESETTVNLSRPVAPRRQLLLVGGAWASPWARCSRSCSP